MAYPETYREKELFDLISEGDEQAFGELFRLTSPVLQTVIYKITGEADHIPDIIQEIYIRVWTNRDKLPEIRAPRTWLINMTYRYTFNWLRRRMNGNKAFAHLPADTEAVFQDPASFSETKKMIGQAIETLSPQARVIYQMSRDQGLNVTDIALQLSLAPQTVKNHLGRAIRSIREYLEKNGITLPVLLLLLLI